MQFCRVILILWITLVLLVMAGCPAMYHSKRTRDAHFEHLVSPGPEAEQGIKDAKQLDRKDVMRCEVALFGLLAASVYTFVRAGKRLDRSHGATGAGK